jgi:hypothetical protein
MPGANHDPRTTHSGDRELGLDKGQTSAETNYDPADT